MELNYNVMRTTRIARDGTQECQDSMREVCMKEKLANEVKCCRCGQKTLVLKRQGTAADPWAKIECTHVYPDGVACGFNHTCGHAEPPPPKLLPKSI